MQDTEKLRYWNQKLKSEPEKVKKRTYEKILKIIGEMDNPYLKRKGLFGRRVVISITGSSGFN